MPPVSDWRLFTPILFDGSSILYTFEIYNPNNYTIDNFNLQFQLRQADTGVILFSESKFISIVKPNQVLNYTTEYYQLNKYGLYDLFIVAKNNYISFKINGVRDEYYTKIRDSIRVYPFSLTGLFAFFALLISAASYYKNHAKIGEILVSLPRFIQVRKAEQKHIIITLPLVFENTGSYSKSISNLALKISKEEKQWLLPFANEYEKFFWHNPTKEISPGIEIDEYLKPPIQFTIPPKSSITKILMFAKTNVIDFKDGEYNLKLIGWEDSSEDSQLLKEFNNIIQRNGIIYDLDKWEESYEKESKIKLLTTFYYKNKKKIISKFKKYFK